MGTVSTGVMLESCNTEVKTEVAQAQALNYDRTPGELAHYQKLMSEKFFDDHEMKTITTLCDIIIPKDDVSGGASEAGVPDFIEFITKDMKHHQVPLRGELSGWICNPTKCLKNHLSTALHLSK